MLRQPPHTNLTVTLAPSTTLCRSPAVDHVYKVRVVGRDLDAAYAFVPGGGTGAGGSFDVRRILPGVHQFTGTSQIVALSKDEADFRRPIGRNVEMDRSEEHTSELPSLMRISYAVFRLKKKNTKIGTHF